MGRHILRLAALTCLAAFAGEVIKQQIDSVLGQPLSAAVARLGMPTEARTIAGKHVYVWNTRNVGGTENKCQVRVIMKGDIIRAWDYEGREASCQQYAARLQ
jgi:hypothetical protein